MDKFELKNVKYYESMSRETSCMQGVLYFKNKKIATFENQGNGGNTNVHKENNQYAIEAENYLKNLEIEFPASFEGDKPLKVDSNFENLVDILFDNWLVKDFEKKIERIIKTKQANHLIMKDAAGDICTVKYSVPIEELISKAPQQLEASVKKHIANGNKLLNTNIPEKFLK